MGGFVYGGKFEQIMNDLCSPKNIAATARKFKELEKQYGSYSFGKFAKYVIPKVDEFANWDRDSGGIPDSIQDQLTDIISTNLRSASPLPVMLKVADNVDATHDLITRAFAHNGYIYIGLLMLCPNPELK
jgi:hypothetical protein